MSPFVAYHSTARRHRESIRQHGLLASDPWKGRPFGVYVFRGDYGHSTFSRGVWVCRWGCWGDSDLWEVAHIGPMTPDSYVENGIILHDPVPPQHLSLITHITPDMGEVIW